MVLLSTSYNFCFFLQDRKSKIHVVQNQYSSSIDPLSLQCFSNQDQALDLFNSFHLTPFSTSYDILLSKYIFSKIEPFALIRYVN